jgi:hypothetical protein
MQSWKNVTAERAVEFDYPNETAEALSLSIVFKSADLKSVGRITVDGVTVAEAAAPYNGYGPTTFTLSAHVPYGSAYRYTGPAPVSWGELGGA